jgi:hypothetical protein
MKTKKAVLTAATKNFATLAAMALVKTPYNYQS